MRISDWSSDVCSSDLAAHQPPEAAAAEADADRVVMLHEALMNDRFELAYQPIVAVAGAEEAQYQTLLRLRDADENMHTTAEILPAAEAAGAPHERRPPVPDLTTATPRQHVGRNRPRWNAPRQRKHNSSNN